MPYPDLPRGETFWRCPHCGNDQKFRASGIGHIQCTHCGRESTAQQLKDAHAASATATASPLASSAPPPSATSAPSA